MLQHEKVKPFLNFFALAISCLMVAHFFASFSSAPLQKLILAIVGIFIDITAQFILALSKLRLRQKHLVFAFFLFLPYLIYIIVFAIPSAIGYCATGFVIQDDVKSKQAYAESLNKTRLGQIEKELNVLNMQLVVEAQNGGYGDKSKKLMDRVDKLSAEQKNLQEGFIKSSETTQKVSKLVDKDSTEVSEVLSKVYNLPENLILIILFSVATGMIYLTLILTSWDLEVKKEIAETKPTLELLKVPESTQKIIELQTNVLEQANFVESSEGPQSSEANSESLQALEKSPKALSDSFQISDESSPTFETLKFPKVRTSPQKYSNELVAFINAAIRDSGSLNSVQKISYLSGLSVEKCMEYQERLDGMEINGDPVVSKGRGVSVVNFTKEIILEYLLGNDSNLYPYA